MGRVRVSSSQTATIRPEVLLRALGSPPRLEVLEQLRASGPASVAELARDLGRSPHSLYYHVHDLERAGLVRRRGTRKASRREEAVYDRVADAIAVAYDAASQAGNEAIERAGRAVLRRAERVFTRAIRKGLIGCATGESDGLVSSRKAWLSPGGVAEVRRLLRRLDAVLARENRRRRGRAYLLTTALSPTHGRETP